MGMTSPFPEPPSPELARFMVRSRVEIVSALRQLRDQHLLVTLYYGDDTAFAVGSVLDVHAGADELIIDLTVDAIGRAAIGAASTLIIVGFIDNVKLQFTTRSGHSLTPRGAAFRLPLPHEMLRLQRRASLRVKTPALICHVPAAPGSPHSHALRVFDLSLGGLSLQGPLDRSLFAVGRVIQGCQIQTASGRRFEVTLRVRHTEPTVGGREPARIGLEFVGLTPAVRNGLQQLIGSVALPAAAEERRAD
ncbi:MAG TPA: flagellar brake protein [Burkholderiaceae bacterium]|nr:flagellar brake protein [Burkholderiaceae bacterium]